MNQTNDLLMKTSILSSPNARYSLATTILVWVSVTVWAAGKPASRAADNSEVKDALLKLDIWLEGQRMKYDLPGFSAGVVHDQELIWSKGYGFADLANKIPA